MAVWLDRIRSFFGGRPLRVPPPSTPSPVRIKPPRVHTAPSPARLAPLGDLDDIGSQMLRMSEAEQIAWVEREMGQAVVRASRPNQSREPERAVLVSRNFGELNIDFGRRSYNAAVASPSGDLVFGLCSSTIGGPRGEAALFDRRTDKKLFGRPCKDPEHPFVADDGTCIYADVAGEQGGRVYCIRRDGQVAWSKGWRTNILDVTVEPATATVVVTMANSNYEGSSGQVFVLNLSNGQYSDG